MLYNIRDALSNVFLGKPEDSKKKKTRKNIFLYSVLKRVF